MRDGPVPATAVAATVRVSVDLRGLDDRPLDALRMMLVADVLRRVAEEHGDRVLLALLEEKTDPAGATASATLGIQPASLRTSSLAAMESFLGGGAEVTLLPAHPAGPEELALLARRTLRIGMVITRGGGNGPQLAPRLLLGDQDPLALRLALLRVPYASPAVLSLARLHRAEQTLQRWRLKVAGWRDMPQVAAPQDTIAALVAALENLDTGMVLRLLHRLEIDPRLPSGGKFEAFTRLDQVLALDLRRLVGKRAR